MRIKERASPWVACLLAVAVATAPACRSLRPMAPETSAPSSPTWTVRPGDDLRVALHDGRTLDLTVKAVEPDAIVATDGARVAFAAIRAVERRQFSPGRTVAAVVGGIAGAFVFVLFAIANALDID